MNSNSNVRSKDEESKVNNTNGFGYNPFKYIDNWRDNFETTQNMSFINYHRRNEYNEIFQLMCFGGYINIRSDYSVAKSE
jgi:hypothetical protein